MRDLRVWLGTLVSLAFLVLLFARVDGGAVWQAFRQIQPAWLLLALPVSACSIWIRALRWRAIIAPHVALSGREATSLAVIGYAANNLLPVRTGELIRAVLVRRLHGGSGATTLGSIVIERIFDGLVLTLMLAVALGFAGSTPVLLGLAALMGLLFGGVAFVLVAFALHPAPVRRLLARLAGLLPERIGTRLLALLERFLAGLTLLRGPRTWGLVAIASLLGWLLEAATYWIVGIAFGLDLPPIAYIGICGAANLAIAAPSTSGGIGPYEFFGREVAVLFGASVAAGTAYALALHAFVLLPVTLAGLFLLWRRGLGLGTLVRSAPTEAAAGPPVHSG